MNHVWTCRCCGQQQNTLPFSFAHECPLNWSALSEEDRAHRGVISSDACVIDEKEFYIRGCLEIPVFGCAPFVWSIWVSISEPSFQRIGELWEVERRDTEGPFFGWLANNLRPTRRPSRSKAQVCLRNAGMRPLTKLEPTDYPLAVEQRNGITLDRVEEIVSAVLRHS